MHILVNRHLEEGGSALASGQRLCSGASVQRSVCAAERASRLHSPVYFPGIAGCDAGAWKRLPVRGQ